MWRLLVTDSVLTKCEYLILCPLCPLPRRLGRDGVQSGEPQAPGPMWRQPRPTWTLSSPRASAPPGPLAEGTLAQAIEPRLTGTERTSRSSAACSGTQASSADGVSSPVSLGNLPQRLATSSPTPAQMLLLWAPKSPLQTWLFLEEASQGPAEASAAPQGPPASH